VLGAGEARVGAAWRPVGRRFESGIAAAAVAALGEHDALARLGEIGDQRLAVDLENLGTDRDAQHGIGAGRAAAVLAHAVAAVLGLEVLLVAIVDQRVEALDRDRNDIAAAAAIAAVRATELDELLAPETDAAGAAVAALDVDLGLIEELHRLPPDRSPGFN
jgi:hypothetical protein